MKITSSCSKCRWLLLPQPWLCTHRKRETKIAAAAELGEERERGREIIPYHALLFLFNGRLNLFAVIGAGVCITY